MKTQPLTRWDKNWCSRFGISAQSPRTPAQLEGAEIAECNLPAFNEFPFYY